MVICNTKYGHFIFFPNTIHEGKARQQCRVVKERLGNILKDIGITHMMGSHFCKWYKKCGFPEFDDDNQSHCITDDCEDQMGSCFYGKCLFFSSGPEILGSQSNCLHSSSFLVHIPMASKEAWGSVAQHVTPKSVNWDLEKVSSVVRQFYDPKHEKQDSFEYKKKKEKMVHRQQPTTASYNKVFSVHSRNMPHSLRIKVL